MAPTNWISCTVDDIKAPIKNSVVGGPFGSNLVSRDYQPFGVPVIRGSNLNFSASYFNSDEFVFVSEEKATELSANIAVPGDIVFTQRGTLGQVGIVPSNLPHKRFVISQSQMKLTCDKSKAHPPFIYYCFKSAAILDFIQRNVISTGVPHINLAILKQTPLLLPPLDKQKAIAHILGTLDDKIELNRQMNRTLEGIARALFKSWFIDFDPVRAKLDGRQPSGIDAETAALFPDAFEDGGESGPIPKGWNRCHLGDFLNLKRGYDLPKRHREEGNVPIISSSGFSGYHSTPKVKAPGVVTGRYGTVGQVFFIEEDFWPLNTTLYVQDFKGNNPKIAYYILEQIDFNVYADKAAVPGVNRNHVHQEKIVAPPKQIQESFSQLLEPTWQQQTVNEREAEALRDLRDTLLPKLLSGEIRVKEAEQTMEVA